MKTHIPLTGGLVQEDLLQKYHERVEGLSQQDRVIKFCTDAGFLTTVQVGQYVMTKETEKFSQFTDSVACREYTLPRDENSSEPKGWIRGNTKMDPHRRSQPVACKVNMEIKIRIMSMNKDNSHSSVRISHGLNKLVTNLNNNEQKTSETQFEEYAFRLNAGDFGSRSKAKAKPQRRIFASSSTKTLPIGERTWTDFEPQDCSSIDYTVSKKLITLLGHGSLLREEDGAIEFWRLKDDLQSYFAQSQHWSDEKWKSTMAKRRKQEKI